MKNTSYFSIDKRLNPLNSIDRWLNPYKHKITYRLDDHQINIALTTRAQRAMSRHHPPLLVELQLYFSCMIKKRVIFHDETTQLSATPVNKYFSIAFRCVQSESCDPVEFATHYPGKKTLETIPALKMHPRELFIDYKNSEWLGEFSV